MSKFVAVDAFCGAGGLSLGLSAAGFNVALSFDLEPLCGEVFQRNKKYHKHKFLCSDVREMLKGRLLKIAGMKKGQVDLLAGGPPCQGFSIQRTIGKDHDPRNLLVDDYAGLILEVKPRFFILENVPGIGGHRGRVILEKFLKKMTYSGYHCHQNVLDAQDYGVPQRRRRVVVVGELCNGDPLFKWPQPVNQAARKTVRGVISHLPAPPADGSEHASYRFHRADKLSEINIRRIRSIVAGQSRVNLPKQLWAKSHHVSADVAGHRNVYGRMEWDDVAPTITARFDSFTRGKFGHPVQDRSISLLEGALLQSFPSDYAFAGNKVDVARQIGNAIPPLMAKAIGLSIISALKLRKK
jgi:DNA (cytosine-5)-methyltransferase 1